MTTPTVVQDVVRDLELLEVDLWMELLETLTAEEQELLGLAVRRLGTATAIMARNADVAGVNRVLALGLEGSLRPEMLEEIIAWYREGGVPRWMIDWYADPLAAREALIRKSCAAGRPGVIQLWAPLTDLPQDDPRSPIRVEETLDRKVFRAVVSEAIGAPASFAPCVGAAVGRPGWHHYLAYLDGVAVGGALLHVREGKGCLAFGGTLPAYRRRGVQAALIVRRFRDARERGCRWVCSQAEVETYGQRNSSLWNLKRAGMQVLYQRMKYVFAGAGSVMR